MNYTDYKSELYTIDFSTKTETCVSNQKQREISRHTAVDLPPHWDVQTEHVAKFEVQIDSTEYNEVLALFNQTIATNCAKILRIERIQNKQWYVQYNSYKNFSPRQNTERKLFHGCPQRSAELIINSFFNRSFAGVNGLCDLLKNYFV